MCFLIIAFVISYWCGFHINTQNNTLQYQSSRLLGRENHKETNAVWLVMLLKIRRLVLWVPIHPNAFTVKFKKVQKVELIDLPSEAFTWYSYKLVVPSCAPSCHMSLPLNGILKAWFVDKFENALKPNIRGLLKKISVISISNYFL